MKSKVTGIAVIVAIGMVTLLPATAAELRVTINGVNGAEGYVMVGLYGDETAFDAQRLDRGAQINARPGSIVVAFPDLPPGQYALNAFHDADESGELETNFLGIPKEGFGFANNARGLAGPPAFDKASITVGEDDMAITFDLNY